MAGQKIPKHDKRSQSRTFNRTKSFKIMKISKFLKAGHSAGQKVTKQDEQDKRSQSRTSCPKQDS